MIFRTFGWSFGVTAAGLAAAFYYGTRTGAGLEFFLLCLILSVLEISLSFDNAVVNATVLERMSAFWQRMFLTIGILIAVFGMRLLFPLLLVGVTAGLNPIEAFDLGLNDPDTYREDLEAAHPAIAAFGGLFLLMLFLDFVFTEREHTWLSFIERPLAKLGRLDVLSVVVGLAALAAAAQFLVSGAEERATVLISGVLGMVAYLITNGLGELFETSGVAHPEGTAEAQQDAQRVAEAAPGATPRPGPSETAKAAGKAGFFLFLYLEVLDASFSFDGVIGAFAVTSDIIIIALGLGIGAMYIRSITIYLVRAGTLNEYVYLEHGAHWAIGALAVLLLVSLQFEVPEVVTGLLGVFFIVAALISSLLKNRRDGAHKIGTHTDDDEREPVAGTV